ncbi:MAG: hypothetical protein JNN17_02000 [Verrucomicrobiaceae bacterium]|nr:hypothetical protein [Verrucomicrobiaceae bacterium]
MQPSPKSLLLKHIGINMLAGMLGAFLVWNYIYSIGSSVIPDAIYESHDVIMIRGGMAFGMLIGVVMAWKRAGLRLMSVLHLLSILAGGVVGHLGWREGMAAYFITSWLVTAFIIFLRWPSVPGKTPA